MIQGKWNGKQYTIQKELGRGANGTVYQATLADKVYAIKVGEDSFSLTSEVNVLRNFTKAQGGILGPSVYDVDDWEQDGETRPFYVMNVIEGISVDQFVKKRGKEWVPVLIIQLLGFLQELHEEGWVFGDLKPDNLQVSGHPPKVAWFDAGGITKAGRAIKEYTEFYDRGYWQMGNRKAEPSYDLFSVGMIFLHLYYGHMIEPGKDPKAQLQRFVFQDSSLFPFQATIWNALEGKYLTAKEMKRDLVQAWHMKKGGKIEQREEKPLRRSVKVKKHSFLRRAISFFFFSSFLIFLFTLYLVAQTF
jgi:serine/threonine-protein kinase